MGAGELAGTLVTGRAGRRVLPVRFERATAVSDRCAVMIAGNDHLNWKAARLDQVTEQLARSFANAPRWLLERAECYIQALDWKHAAAVAAQAVGGDDIGSAVAMVRD